MSGVCGSEGRFTVAISRVPWSEADLDFGAADSSLAETEVISVSCLHEAARVVWESGCSVVDGSDFCRDRLYVYSADGLSDFDVYGLRWEVSACVSVDAEDSDGAFMLDAFGAVLAAEVAGRSDACWCDLNESSAAEAWVVADDVVDVAAAARADAARSRFPHADEVAALRVLAAAGVVPSVGDDVDVSLPAWVSDALSVSWMVDGAGHEGALRALFYVAKLVDSVGLFYGSGVRVYSSARWGMTAPRGGSLLATERVARASGGDVFDAVDAIVRAWRVALEDGSDDVVACGVGVDFYEGCTLADWVSLAESVSASLGLSDEVARERALDVLVAVGDVLDALVTLGRAAAERAGVAS